MRFDDGRERTALRKGRPGGLRAAFAPLGSVLLLVVVGGLALTRPWAGEDDPCYQVRGGSLDLRADPGATDEVTTRLRNGARLEVTDRTEGDWVFVRSQAGGHEGWVSRRELDAKAILVQESG